MVQQSPKDNLRGWVYEILDAEEAFTQREWQKYCQYTPAERIKFGEELRRMVYGNDAIDARIQRVFTTTE
jgi:hypothetical protein